MRLDTCRQFRPGGIYTADRVYVKNLYPKGRASLTPKSANLNLDIGNALIAAEAIRRAAQEGKTITITIHDEGHLRVSYKMGYPK